VYPRSERSEPTTSVAPEAANANTAHTERVIRAPIVQRGRENVCSKNTNTYECATTHVAAHIVVDAATSPAHAAHATRTARAALEAATHTAHAPASHRAAQQAVAQVQASTYVAAHATTHTEAHAAPVAHAARVTHTVRAILATCAGRESGHYDVRDMRQVHQLSYSTTSEGDLKRKSEPKHPEGTAQEPPHPIMPPSKGLAHGQMAIQI
jgi:hypothetical protein